MAEKEINIEDGDRQEEKTVKKTEKKKNAKSPGIETEETEETKAEEAEEANNSDAIDKAREDLAALNDKYLRTMAEFDNYRKRTLKEKADLILNGAEKTVTSILPVLDDMERAIENNKKTSDPEVLKEGMFLIHQKLVKILESLGLSVIETKDADFDTDYHEAVAMVPGVSGDKKGKVIDCLQKGYKLNDKVIRHAKVAVGQ